MLEDNFGSNICNQRILLVKSYIEKKIGRTLLITTSPTTQTSSLAIKNKIKTLIILDYELLIELNVHFFDLIVV